MRQFWLDEQNARPPWGGGGAGIGGDFECFQFCQDEQTDVRWRFSKRSNGAAYEFYQVDGDVRSDPLCLSLGIANQDPAREIRSATEISVVRVFGG